MKKKMNIHPFDYYALLFFTTAFAGWLWEVLLYIVTAYTFINRGVYRGPFLTIYDDGCLFPILIFLLLRRHPVVVFVCSGIVCSALEYGTGVWLERKWGIRWWDYSGHIGNLDGHICLASSIGFGLGGALLICVFQPVFNKLYHRMTIGLRMTLCIVFLLVFIADAAYAAMTPSMGNHITAHVILAVEKSDHQYKVMHTAA